VPYLLGDDCVNGFKHISFRRLVQEEIPLELFVISPEFALVFLMCFH
jgi:hypothetical protein